MSRFSRTPLFLFPLALGGCAGDGGGHQGSFGKGWSKPTPLELGSPVGFECETLAEGQLGAPVPWTTLDPDWLAYGDWLDASPYAGTRDTFRGVHDLVVHRGVLHAGVGDMEVNPGSMFCADTGGPCPRADVGGHGLPIYTWDEAGEPDWSLVVREEVVERFRRSGDGLLVPGSDPSEGDGLPKCAKEDADPPCPAEEGHAHGSYELGHVYSELGGWRVSADIAKAWHILDVTWFQGALFAAGSGIERPDDNGSDGTIWRSEDGGRLWTVDLALRNHADFHERFWLLIPAGDRLYAYGTRLDAAAPPRDLSQVWDGSTWSSAEGLLDELNAVSGTEPFAEGRTLVWGWAGGARTAVEINAQGSQPVAFFDGGTWGPVDASLRCDGDMLVLSERTGLPGRWAIHRSSDLVSFEELVSWDGARGLTALAAWQGGVVLADRDGGLHRASMGSGLR